MARVVNGHYFCRKNIRPLTPQAESLLTSDNSKHAKLVFCNILYDAISCLYGFF